MIVPFLQIATLVAAAASPHARTFSPSKNQDSILAALLLTSEISWPLSTITPFSSLLTYESAG
jgi:hypothetical protein